MVALSVVIPCYNYGRYLKESLDSVLSQDFSDFEVVLVDDGSTDETSEIGEAYAREYPQLHYIRCPQNVGLFKAAKIGLEAAQGEYLHYFSSDDRYLPGFLSKSMQILRDNPKLGLVCSTVGYFQDGSDIVESKPLIPECTESKIFTKNELIEVIHQTDFYVTGTSCVVRRSLLDQYGGFDPKLENIADWFLFHKIAFSEGIAYIPETLISMRVHDQAYTSCVKRDKKRKRATFHYLLRKLLEDQTLRQDFIKAGLLDFVFRDLKWKLYLNPRYRSYWL